MNEILNNKKQGKIVILGLDNSGKTSIVLSLKEKSNIMSFLSLRPTKGYNIERFESDEYDFSIWDFGGQEQYRTDYLKNFNHYMKEASRVIFVFDIQDIGRYELALTYFKDIMNLLDNQDIKIHISIFLHKFDPGLMKQEQFRNIEEILKSTLVDKLIKLIPSNWYYDIFKTCIYTVFEKISY